MSKLTENAKGTIDAMSVDELRLEINKGRNSRFQGEKFDYLKTRFDSIMQQEKMEERQENVSFKKDELSLAREANQISKKANKQSWIAIAVAVIAALFALGSLIVDIVNSINTKTP
jgi:hypothetical protein